MVRGNGMGNNWKGYYTTSLMDAYGRGRMTRANDYSPTVKLVLLLGLYLETFYTVAITPRAKPGPDADPSLRRCL
jgi:amidase